MRLGARLAVLLRLKPRGRSPAQRVQNPYRRLYPGRARVFVQKFLADPGPRRGKR